jgi:hypothetical protein
MHSLLFSSDMQESSVPQARKFKLEWDNPDNQTFIFEGDIVPVSWLLTLSTLSSRGASASPLFSDHSVPGASNEFKSRLDDEDLDLDFVKAAFAVSWSTSLDSSSTADLSISGILSKLRPTVGDLAFTFGPSGDFDLDLPRFPLDFFPDSESPFAGSIT